MLAILLVSLYPLLDTRASSSRTVPAGQDAVVTASRGAEQVRTGEDGDANRAGEHTPTRATALSRAAARAGAMAHAAQAAQDAQAARDAQTAQTAEDAAAGIATEAPAGAVDRGTATTAIPPSPAWGGVPGAGTGEGLSWAPPAEYRTYPVKRIAAAGTLNTVDGGGGDVQIELSRSNPVGPLVIKNCRNAVLIGGAITVLPSDEVDGHDQRGIYVTKCTGTIHIEGVQINGDVAGSESDGIAVNAPEATVQIQNVRVDGMRGGHGSNHADVFQPWGGVREFRIDRLTGSTNYQGLHIGEDLGPIGRGTIRNTNIASSEAGTIDRGGQFIWMECNGYPLTLDNLYIAGRSGRSFGTSIWPQQDASTCAASIKSGVASWPDNKTLTGSIREGRPPTDFVPAGSVGLGYASPGYR